MSIILNRRSDNVPVVFETKDLVQSKINTQNNTITLNGVQYNFSSLREIQNGSNTTVINTVIGFTTAVPPEPVIGDRYIVSTQGDPESPWAEKQNYIVEYLGANLWKETVPEEGMSVRVIQELNENEDLSFLEYVYHANVNPNLCWIHENVMESYGVRDRTIQAASFAFATPEEVLAEGDMIYRGENTLKVLSAQNVLEGSKLIIGQNGLPQYCNTQPQYITGTTPYTLAEFQALTTCKIGERYIVDTDGLGAIKCVEVVTKNPETHVVVYSIFHDLYDHSR
jgi:hypothetical protein